MCVLVCFCVCVFVCITDCVFVCLCVWVFFCLSVFVLLCLSVGVWVTSTLFVPSCVSHVGVIHTKVPHVRSTRWCNIHT